jgi:hypothetical protein
VLRGRLSRLRSGLLRRRGSWSRLCSSEDQKKQTGERMIRGP